jgi:hypothetical protein
MDFVVKYIDQWKLLAEKYYGVAYIPWNKLSYLFVY